MVTNGWPRSAVYKRSERLAALIGVFLFAALPAYGHRSSINYSKRWVAGIPAYVVTINLNDLDVRVSPVVPQRGVGRSESWRRMLNRARPTAAITGTFFDTRSLYPTGDIVVDGDMVHRGVVGTAIGIGWNNEISFIPTKRGRISEWSAFQHVLVAGPVLVWDGKPSVYPRVQGFRDGRFFRKRPRAAVGMTRSGKLLMVVVRRPVHLSRLAKAMRALGAVRAAALDGGGSTALYYRGRTIVKPSRRLTNLLVAYDTDYGYERVRRYLTPGRDRLSRRP